MRKKKQQRIIYTYVKKRGKVNVMCRASQRFDLPPVSGIVGTHEKPSAAVVLCCAGESVVVKSSQH